MTATTRRQRWPAALLCAAAAVLAWLAAAWPARAHDVGTALRMHAFVHVEAQRLRLVLRVPLELLLNVDLPKRGNGYLDLERIDDALPRALQASAKGLEVFEDGVRLAPVHGEARIALPSDRAFASYEQALAAVRGVRLPPGTDVFWNQGYFDAVLEYPVRSADARFAVDFHVAPGLRERLKLDLRYLTPAGDVRAFELTTGSGRVPLDPRWTQAAATFVQSGFAHIVGGLDHLLFLLCLVVPFRRVGWPLVGIVTAFTAAHALTVSVAALGWVPGGDWFAPLVEAAIAASILYMAADNVLGPTLRWRWLLAALFGLVHGFGFSFGLAHELQFAGSHLVVSLLAFNLGIELGQLAVLALAWPALAWLLRRFAGRERIVVLLLSAGVAHAAWHWLVERVDALRQASWPPLDTLPWPQAAAALLLALALALLVRAARRPAPPVAGRVGDAR